MSDDTAPKAVKSRRRRSEGKPVAKLIVDNTEIVIASTRAGAIDVHVGPASLYGNSDTVRVFVDGAEVYDDAKEGT